MNPEDRAAKMDFVEAFFDDLHRRVDFTAELEAAGHHSEARLLCCCYLEGLGSALYPGLSGRPTEAFVKVLSLYGGAAHLSLVVVPRLAAALPAKSASSKVVAELQRALAKLPAAGALEEAELLQAVAADVSPKASVFLRANLWRGTVAAIAYDRIRSLAVHSLGSPDFLSFSKTTHHGAPLPDIDFSVLKQALDRILAHAREVSLQSGRWFGHA